MEEMKKAELIFIPASGAGHIFSCLEVAKLLADRNQHLSITFLIMKHPTTDTEPLYKSSHAHPRIKFLELRNEECSPQDRKSPYLFYFEFIDSHKAHVREILAEITSSESSNLTGIVLDMFCTSMIDAANEFGIPTYVFYTSGAAMLGLTFHLQSLRDDFNIDVTEYENSDEELAIPTYINPVPPKVLPSLMFDKNGGCDAFLNQVKRYRETKGIIINTFYELESHAIQVLLGDKTVPPVYAIGPLLKLNRSSDENQETEMIMKWLDLQPHCSVLFLCFGSGGSFSGDQVKEIASALEHSGCRFLWSLRKPPPKAKGKYELPTNYENLEEVLPQEFLQRTAEVGKVIGWAPQVEILSHPAVGGFVSHCGWNSTLESVWYGVPMATWPLYAEQQVNAFLLVKDLRMAVEIKMDYRKDIRAETDEVVSADVIENGIKCLVDPENEIRSKVKEMKEKSRMAVTEKGSSSVSLSSFLNIVTNKVIS